MSPIRMAHPPYWRGALRLRDNRRRRCCNLRPLRIVLTVGILSAVGIIAGCTRHSAIDLEKPGSMPDKTIEEVQEEHTGAWMTIPGVVGTAIGECRGKPCILVLTASDTQQIRRKIPAIVDGYPVVVQYTGEIRARDEQQ